MNIMSVIHVNHMEKLNLSIKRDAFNLCIGSYGAASVAIACSHYSISPGYVTMSAQKLLKGKL